MKKNICALLLFFFFFLRAADTSISQAVHIPVESRTARSECFALWIESLHLDANHGSAQISFSRQFDALEKFEIPCGKIIHAGVRMIDPSIRFLYLFMEKEFEHDQAAQWETANSGKILSRKSTFRSVRDFERFQFRKGGPGTLTVTKKGREILTSLVVQYPEYPTLLEKFATDKKIAPGCLEKMQEQAKDLSNQIEVMKIDGRFR